MRKSAAPSQLNKRGPFFSPPYKNASAKRQCTPLIRQALKAGESNLTSVEKYENERPHPLKKRSPADVLSIIKSPVISDSIDSLNPLSIKSDAPIIKETSCSSNHHLSDHYNNDFDREIISEDRNLCENFANGSTKDQYNISGLEAGRNLFTQIDGNSQIVARYFSVVWCKRSNKKHKNWEGDAILIVKGRSVTLKDVEGKEIGRSSGYKLKDLESLEEGNTLPVGAKEVEIQGIISEVNFMSGKCFQSSSILPEILIEKQIISKPKIKPFRLPVRKDEVARLKHENQKTIKPLFDVLHPDAIVLPKPPPHHQWQNNVNSLPVTDVVVDPYLGSKLRPHQQAGVVFLYECVSGFRVKGHQGAILADEMGLGKTLQCITLIWTLLKQGPYGCSSVLKKVLIATPSSLSANWGKEFDKWLGSERIKPFIVDQKNKVEDFIKHNASSVLIISYEMLIRTIDKINDIKFDLLLCDEGHRLKNGHIKTTSLLASLKIKKRIIVTGTPIQNDMQELFALIEFVNPGILGSSSMFRKIYEEPILRLQQPSATIEEKAIGESRAEELNRLTSQFTLRRTQEIINRYLPPKSEFVIFCQPTKFQAELYEAVIGSRGLQKCLSDSEAGDHLSAICILRKLCNHPSLLNVYENKENLSDIQNEISNLLPKDRNQTAYLEEDSGKLAVVSCLLWCLAEAKKERIVIVSNFTTTLNMLQQLCERYNYKFLRLDGSTPTSKRQSLVDRFNSIHSQEFVFLLSSKAGGVGLNLIGASRILLFDIDWNPATDLQAMARVWRDGQKKNVYIYRLLLSGSIEEKMYQRQVFKQGISGSVVDARSSSKVRFSVEELKDLFMFDPNASCLTHDLLRCSCDQMGNRPTETSFTNSNEVEERDCQLSGGDVNKLKGQNQTTMDQLHSWQHISLPQGTDVIGDPFLESGSDFINFVFKCQTSQENCNLFNFK